jgi:hypothetical protein
MLRWRDLSISRGSAEPLTVSLQPRIDEAVLSARVLAFVSALFRLEAKDDSRVAIDADFQVVEV